VNDHSFICDAALDGYFELDLAPWDFAARAVIAGAAGAHVPHLEARDGQGPAIIAASSHLTGELVRLLRAADALTCAVDDHRRDDVDVTAWDCPL